MTEIRHGRIPDAIGHIWNDRMRPGKSRAIAERAVQDYRGQLSFEDPLATFLPEGISELDLRNYPSGTILRIPMIENNVYENVDPYYAWLVTGVVDEGGVDVYAVTFQNRSALLVPTLNIKACHDIAYSATLKNPFEVKDSLKQLLPHANTPSGKGMLAEVYVPQKIDVMHITSAPSRGQKLPVVDVLFGHRATTSFLPRVS